MDQVSTVAIDSTQWWTIICNSDCCSSIELIEDYLNAGVTYRYRRMNDSGTGGGAGAGTPALFKAKGRRYFQKGEAVGQLKADAGSGTFRQTEN